MQFIDTLSHLTLGLILLTLQIDLRVLSARTSNEKLSPKLKCLKNLTAPSTDPQSQIILGIPRCVTLSHPYCLDIKLPYNSVALVDTFPDLNLKSFEDVQAFLERWRGAQKLPACWHNLQVALCSLLMPKCEEDPSTGRAIAFHQPAVDICLDLTNPNKTNCKLIQKRFSDEYSTLFACNDTNFYAKNCTDERRALRQGISTKEICQEPLVPSSNHETWVKDIEGCSLHCRFPVSNSHDQLNITLMIKILCITGLICTILATLLFEVNRASNKASRVAKVIIRCTICQLLIYVGWSLQFALNQNVGCRTDGSRMYGQPLVANSCTLSFLLTYLPSLSSLLWCTHLAKLCHAKYYGREKNIPGSAELDRTLSLFNYGIPLTLFVLVAFIGQIDGNGLYGICTVGQQSVIIKTIFVFLPSLLGTVYGNYFFVKIIYRLVFIETKPMKPSLRRHLIRIFALATLTILQVTFSVANYFYEFMNQHDWLQSLEQNISCQLNQNYDTNYYETARLQQECTPNSSPFLTLYYLEILSTLSIGIVYSSWAFYDANYRGLIRTIINKLADDKERRRLAKEYCVREQGAIRGYDGGLLSGRPVRDSETTYHDLIDMTPPPRCFKDRECVDVELARNLDDNQSEDHASEAQIQDRGPVQITRGSSFSSITIHNFLNISENSSNTFDRSNRHKKGGGKLDKASGMRSRDVINDCRQKYTNELQNPNGYDSLWQPSSVTSTADVGQIAMASEMYRFFSSFAQEAVPLEQGPQPDILTDAMLKLYSYNKQIGEQKVDEKFGYDIQTRLVHGFAEQSRQDSPGVNAD